MGTIIIPSDKSRKVYGAFHVAEDLVGSIKVCLAWRNVEACANATPLQKNIKTIVRIVDHFMTSENVST